jgi:5'-nucleotidase (lipoprotein e(P4) family)
MLVGDNLGDFSDVFYKKTSDERNAAVERLHAEFGRRFIMLPNVMYGDWLSSLYPKNVKLNAQQMDSVLRHAVKGL